MPFLFRRGLPALIQRPHSSNVVVARAAEMILMAYARADSSYALAMYRTLRLPYDVHLQKSESTAILSPYLAGAKRQLRQHYCPGS